MIDVAKFVESLDIKPVYVFGLGKSGLATIKALVKAGAEVIAWDDDADKHAAAKRAKAELKSLEKVDFSALACVVLSPGIPLTHPQPHPVVTKAEIYGVEIISDMEIFHRCGHGCRTIGITGTNGKSTTTALIGHILNKCGMRAAVGGNIGKPVLEMKLTEKTQMVVLEISSYQLDICSTFTPDIGVLLNVTPDHIDRHGSLENYAAVKARIFSDRNEAILSIDHESCRNIYTQISSEERKPVAVSTEKEVEYGVTASAGRLIDTMDGKSRDIGPFNMLPALAGLHNHENAIAAYAAARKIGLSSEEIFKAMKSFPGLPHRQQVVRTINGVAYINDSKATNAEAVGKALATYRNLYWILGGRPKEGGLSGLEPYIDRVRHAFLIGESAEDFSKWLERHGVVHHFSKTLQRAVHDAHDQAQSERGQPGGTGVVLLSPACAAFDQFENFEKRGEAFITFVDELEQE